jgi:hypothetical protein
MLFTFAIFSNFVNGCIRSLRFYANATTKKTYSSMQALLSSRPPPVTRPGGPVGRLAE